MKRIKLFVMNSLILSVTSILMRTIGVSFNVYISGKIGFSGMGLIELIMMVYSFAIILATSGVGLAATRLVAEELANKSDAGVNEAMRKCLTYCLAFGIAAALLMLVGAEFAGTYLLKDARTIKPLRILSFCLPFIAVQSAVYGYFTAVRKVAISAAVQVAEQLFSIGMTVYFLNISLSKGIASACTAMTGAELLSEIFTSSLIFILFLHDKKRFGKRGAKPQNLTKRMLGISLPIAFSSYVCSALYTIKGLMIPLGLIKYGLSRDAALAQFGVISGMVMPVILFPAAFLSAFSSLIVPEITECCRLNNTAKINRIITRAFQITLLFSVGVIGIFLSFPYEFGMAIFKDINIGAYIQILAPLILVIYLDSVVDAMLKGLNQQVSSMFYNIFDSAFSIVLVFFLLPKFGIKGLLLVMFLSKLFNTFLSVNKIIRVTDFRIDFVSWIVKPVIAIFISITFARVITGILKSSYCSLTFLLVVNVAVSFMAYLVILRMTSCITSGDLALARNIFRREK